MKVNLLQRFTLLSVGATVVLAVGSGLVGSLALSRGLLSNEAQVTAEAVRAITNVDLPREDFVRAVREKDEQKFRYIWSHIREIREVFRVHIYDGDGKIVVEKGRILGIDEESLYDKLQTIGRDLMRRVGISLSHRWNYE